MKNQGRALIGALVFSVIGIGYAFHLAANQKMEPPAVEKVSPYVIKAYENTLTAEGVDVIVLLKDQADLSGAERLETKALKGKFVYQKLVEKAAASQTDLIQWLKDHQL